MTRYVVTVSVADLRREPSEGPKNYAKDPLQDSQLLLGEHLQGYEQVGDYLRIEALQQKKWDSSGIWKSYPGWVRRDQLTRAEQFSINNLIIDQLWAPLCSQPSYHSVLLLTLSMGTQLTGSEFDGEWFQITLPGGGEGYLHRSMARALSIDTPFDRDEIIKMGRTFLGGPYFWGGRSAYREGGEHGVLTGVDCSGLVNLLYRIQGIELPRDADCQYRACEPIEPAQLQLGDLVFMENASKRGRIGHVMLYASGDQLLESTMASQSVRMISFEERLGKSLAALFNGACCGDHYVHFGKIR